MDMGLKERTVTVNRPRLLEILQTNREKHRREYQESVEGYKVLAKERLEKLHKRAVASLKDSLELIESKIDGFDPEDDEGLTDHVTLINSMSFHLQVPKDYTSAYDVAIQMAEWEVNETVELTQGQFQCFVMDDWDWRSEFNLLNKAYSSASASSGPSKSISSSKAK